ncbi:MAG: hypothetical protein IPG58_07640 [Acidobacteria bacterium]|nr:hypothetical protein [Acidobacteriota bacterium]
MRFIRNLNFGICPVLLLLIAFTSGSLGQLTKNEFLKQMAATASEAELTALRNGNILVKVLPSRDKREVSVLGGSEIA